MVSRGVPAGTLAECPRSDTCRVSQQGRRGVPAWSQCRRHVNNIRAAAAQAPAAAAARRPARAETTAATPPATAPARAARTGHGAVMERRDAVTAADDGGDGACSCCCPVLVLLLACSSCCCSCREDAIACVSASQSPDTGSTSQARRGEQRLPSTRAVAGPGIGDWSASGAALQASVCLQLGGESGQPGAAQGGISGGWSTAPMAPQELPHGPPRGTNASHAISEAAAEGVGSGAAARGLAAAGVSGWTAAGHALDSCE